MHFNFSIQLFTDFAFQGLLRRLPSLHLATRKLPPALKLSITSLGGEDLAISNDYCCNDLYCFHDLTRLHMERCATNLHIFPISCPHDKSYSHNTHLSLQIFTRTCFIFIVSAENMKKTFNKTIRCPSILVSA